MAHCLCVLFGLAASYYAYHLFGICHPFNTASNITRRTQLTKYVNLCINNVIYPAIALYEQSICNLTEYFLLYTVTDQNIDLSGTPVTCYPLSLGNIVVNSVQFLLKISKGAIKG